MINLEDIIQLSKLPPSQLRARWRETYSSAAPALTPDLLARGIAYRLQERVEGGLNTSVQRTLERLHANLLTNGEMKGARDLQLRPGARLLREWGDRMHVVDVTDDGFRYEEAAYASLSQVAHAITGAKWSGPRFFGLKPRYRGPDTRQRRIERRAEAANG